MASTTVAPVESYTSDSIVPTPDNYAQFSDQTRVSVNLVDSNLWLVDSSKLSAQITDTSSTVPILDWTVAAQTTVSLDNIAAVDEPVNLATLSGSTVDPYLSSDLPLDSMLQLSAVSGQTQLSGSTAGSGSSSSSGSTSGDLSSLLSSASFSSGDTGGGSSLPNFSSSTSATSSSTPQDSATLSGGSGSTSNLSTSTSSGTSTITSSGTASDPTQSTPTTTTQTGSSLPLNPSPQTPEQVPFDTPSSLGLALLLMIVGGKRMMRLWYAQFHLKHQN